MKRRFVIAVDGLSAEEEKKVSELFTGKHAWWHWIDGFWLLTDPTNTLTSGMLRDMITGVNPTARRLVLEVKPSGDWAGFGPVSEERDMFRWIRETWLSP